MTVKELKKKLSEYDEDKLVYILDWDGTVQTVSGLDYLEHTDLPEGIEIPNDVFLLTPATEEYLKSLDE